MPWIQIEGKSGPHKEWTSHDFLYLVGFGVIAVSVAGLLLITACSVATAPQSQSLGSSSASPPAPASSAEDPYFPGLFNSAQTAGGPGFSAYRCEFKVPSIPVLKRSLDSRFLWCGVQQNGVPAGQFGVLQPVLMFGRDCIEPLLPKGQKIGPDNDPSYARSPYWYVSAQYVYPDPSSPKRFRCTTGPAFKVNPGETLNSAITYDPTADTMTVSVSAGSDHSSLVVKHPKDDLSLSWRQFVGGNHFFFNAVIEVPQPLPRDALPTEILKGWTITARVEPLPGLPQLPPNAWEFWADPCNTLDVECVYDSARLESVCTWRAK